MKLAGKIIKITDTFISLETNDKKQNIDVFYTSKNTFGVKKLMMDEFVTLSITIQSVSYNGQNLARCWLISFLKEVGESKANLQEKSSNWTQRRMEVK